MKKYLLFGAGFSRNWHGLLATEVFEHLLSAPEVMADPYLRPLMFKHRSSGFELALSEVQADYRRDAAQYGKALTGIQTAIARIFDRMNRSYEKNLNGIEFQNFKHLMLRTFLVAFDAIFTLNQDVLLELHYLQHVLLAGEPRRWDGLQIPGMIGVRSEEQLLGQHWAAGTLVPSSLYEFHARLQPLIKLHGSSNWREAGGGPLMILGADKLRAIGSSSILARYFEYFSNCLCGEPSRVCVIGYGFRDTHINDVLLDAVNKQGMKFFLIDPAGAELYRSVNPTDKAPIYCPGPVDQIFELGLGGVSKRGLAETFGGTDLVSFDLVNEFFGLAQRRA
jgi:SIR2-like domain